MPTYDYRCEGCGHELAVFHGITEDALKKCPKCHEDRLRRLIGAGAGIIFKGSGFYETDYKRSRSSPSDGESKSSESESKPKPEKKKESSSSSDSKKSDDS